MGTSFGTFFLLPPFSYNGEMRPFAAGDIPLTLTRYASSDIAARYFCSTCGAHVFMHYGGEDALTPSDSDLDEWWVCSGVVDGDLNRAVPQLFKTVAQIWVEGTKDGGLAYLGGHPTSEDIERVPAHETGSISPKSPVIPSTSLEERLRHFISSHSSEPIRDETLIAQCYCHSTTILLSRPDVPSSYPPTTRDGPDWHESLDRPEGADEVWWLRPSLTDPGKRDRLATIPCACTDCRKCTGSETVSWTYTPTGRIRVVLRPIVSPASGTEAKVVPWSTIASYVRSSQSISTATSITESLPGELEGYSLPFRVYNSSKDTYRGFCGTCGATIFWYGPQGGTRDNMIDLSAALFSEPSALGPDITQATQFSGNDSLGREEREVGSRRDDWLYWKADRVTGSSDAEGRGDLVERIGEGLKSKDWKGGLTL